MPQQNSDEPTKYYIGLMSGTSTDGVDGALVAIEQDSFQVIAHHSIAFNTEFRHQLLHLNQSGANELHLSAIAANQLVHHYAQVCIELLKKSQLTASQIQAIGAHGQTVRHCPHLIDSETKQSSIGYSIQINNPALLAELTGICVVADFRSRDIAAGGQGAPLAPAFHQAYCSLPQQDSAVLNLGGIANLSLLFADHQVIGFDTGPANILIDAWCKKQLNKDYDENGTWASHGTVNDDLLNLLISEPYFKQIPPKSTGRDLFNLNWLQQCLTGLKIQAQDVQATLTELTAISIVDDLLKYQPNCRRLLICGGGYYNNFLINQIKKHATNKFSNLQIASSELVNIKPLEMEAAAFAWLASQALMHKTANLPTVTGAKGKRILGAIYY